MFARKVTRRKLLTTLGQLTAGAAAIFALRPVKTVARSFIVAAPGLNDYDPTQHSWRMAIDIDKCIGCGMCAVACKKENKVSPLPSYFRTWVERYIIKKPGADSIEPRGQVLVDSPNGGIDGFPPRPQAPKESILKSFFVPKLCNQCVASPCVKACPVGATFDSPDGAVLIDEKYCIGCGFCIQSCPYGCRFINPENHMAEKCSFCYHRITRGLKPACVEVCPTGARVFGDMKDPNPDSEIRRFYQTHKLQALKPHLGTHPNIFYAGLDKEVN